MAAGCVAGPDGHHPRPQPRKAPNLDPLLLPIEEAGRVIGVGRTTMYQLIQSGELRTVTVGRRRLVPVAELVAYVERLTGEL